MLLRKKDAEEIVVPKISSVDFEYNIKQLPVFNTKAMVTELFNDIVSNAFNLSQKIKCEVCESMFSNID